MVNWEAKRQNSSTRFPQSKILCNLVLSITSGGPLDLLAFVVRKLLDVVIGPLTVLNRKVWSESIRLYLLMLIFPSKNSGALNAL